jgi:putative hydrolase of the HAD superfamily
LKARFKLGVVSNFYGNLDRILAEFRLDRLFTAVADSSRIGIFKPELGIFDAAIRQMRVAPEMIAVIGDSPDKDCAPARQLGLRTVWLCTDAARAGASAKVGIADRTIRSIDELLELQW